MTPNNCKACCTLRNRCVHNNKVCSTFKDTSLRTTFNATSSMGKLRHLSHFLFIILWSCVAVIGRKNGMKPGNDRSFASGLSYSMMILFGFGILAICSWIARMSASGSLTPRLALPVVSFGASLFYVTCSAAMNLLFYRREMNAGSVMF